MSHESQQSLYMNQSVILSDTNDRCFNCRTVDLSIIDTICLTHFSVTLYRALKSGFKVSSKC